VVPKTTIRTIIKKPSLWPHLALIRDIGRTRRASHGLLKYRSLRIGLLKVGSLRF
jgi:hypothetical protein